MTTIKPYILGYGAVTACGDDVQTSWQAIMAGQSGIKKENSAVYPTAQIFSDKKENFAFYLACQAIDKALAPLDKSQRKETALILSTAKGEIGNLEDFVENKIPHQLEDFLPQKLGHDLAQKFGLASPVIVTSNACASGLIALGQGMRLINDGDFNKVLVVGVDLCTPFVVDGFGCLRALSPEFTKPYDQLHQGLNLGAGSGAILLSANKEESILGQLEGFGISNDANHITGPSRTGDGLAAAMQKALQMAGLNSTAIDLVNGHGTGTRYNDDMELLAIKTIFGQNCPLVFSYKGYIGHTIGAAGVIEAALTLEGLSRQQYPASAGFDSNTALPEGINISTKAVSERSIKRVMACKAGFGGINAALIISRV